MFGNKMAPLLYCAVVWVCAALHHPADSYYIQHQPSAYEYPEGNIDRDKRYTETQDRASSFCTGMCMYDQRKAYGDCYDMCNWNGKGASPWTKLEKGKSEDGGSADAVEAANMAALMRSGSGGGKLKVNSGNRNKQWRKKGTWS